MCAKVIKIGDGDRVERALSWETGDLGFCSSSTTWQGLCNSYSPSLSFLIDKIRV